LQRLAPEKRVYVDESGVNTCLQREYGRAPRGEKVHGLKAGSKFQRRNIIAALCQERHFAVECYAHPTDAAFFENWFTNTLLNALPKRAGYTVILDNAAFHRKKALRKLAWGKIRLLFLPPYSPDYNRIEKSWANMKRYLRDNISKFPSLDTAVYDYFDVSTA